MGSREVRLFHDHLLVKEPGTRQATPWHQDQPYYNVEGSKNCSMWMPVDPVDRESTVEFVAGSHRGPWLMPRTFMDDEAKWFPEGSLEELPDIEGDRDAFEILAWDLEPGDAVFFHMLTLHAAGGATRIAPADDLVAAPAPASPGEAPPRREALTRTMVLAARPDERASIVEAHLQREVARVLGLPPSRLDVSQPLNTLGIDSLMALELKKQIESELQVEVPLIKVIQGPSVAELAGLLLSLLAGVDVLTEAPATPQPLPRVTGESLLLSLLSLREDERSG